MENTGRRALRAVKNYTGGYSEIQKKVREATSNDPWGPSGALMNEIAQATFNQYSFHEIMEILDKRLNDKGKNWRHVFKALTVLDYCIHCGSDIVVKYAKDNIYIVKTLREFQHVDDSGRDQGFNVRQKAKDITTLLLDEERLKSERGNANRYRSNLGSYGGFSSGPGSYSTPNLARRRSFEAPEGPGYGDEERETRIAKEMSLRMVRSQSRSRHIPENYNEEEALRRAIEESKREASKTQKAPPVGQQQPAPLSALKGSEGQEGDLLGLFEDAAPPMALNSTRLSNQFMLQQQPQQQMMMQQPFDPSMANAQQFNNQFNAQFATHFGNPQQQAMLNTTGINGSGVLNDFQGLTGFDSTGFNMGSVATSINTPTAASPFDTLTSQNSSTINYEMGGQNPFAASRGPGSMASAAVSPGVSGPDTLTGMFGNAFDGGSAAKPLPFSINPNDPNSKLADIARNSARIDPFANLASGGSGTVHNTANPSNGFGSLADLTSSMFPATSNIGGSRSQQAFGSVNRNPFFDSGLAGGGSSNGMSSPFGSSPKPTLNQLQQSFSAGGGQPGYTTANPFGNSAANSGGTGGSLI